MLTHSRLYVHVFQQASLRKPFTYNLPKRYALENFYCENFQGCIVVYLSRFCFVVAVFLRDSLLRISHAFRFVNNFFKLFFVACRSLFLCFVYLGNESEYITLIVLCQHLFFIFFKLFLQFVFLPIFDILPQKIYNSIQYSKNI